MIIGINGYIGSGKDTVGRIIQWLTFDMRHLNPVSPFSYEDYDKLAYPNGSIPIGQNILRLPEYTIKKFAGKLKEIASMFTGIPVEMFEDQSFKKTYLPHEWDIYGLQITVREFLQRLGTEAIRDNLHDDAWVNALMSDYRRIKNNSYSSNGTGDYPNWIITDVRFPNEAKAIKKRDGLLIRVNRLPSTSDFLVFGEDIQRHTSEISLDDWEFDEVIENDGGIDKLIYLTELVLVKHKLI